MEHMIPTQLRMPCICGEKKGDSDVSVVFPCDSPDSAQCISRNTLYIRTHLGIGVTSEFFDHGSRSKAANHAHHHEERMPLFQV